MAFKNVIKTVYKAMPFKKNIFSTIKLIYKPNEKIYQHLYFNGIFNVKVDNKNSFKMHHYGYQLENEIFWNGLQNGWEKISVNLWIQLCKQANTILDIGANTGVFALIAKTVNPKAIVYAFEPIPKAYNHLKENILINNYNIHAIEKAVSNFNGTAEIFLPNESDFVYSVTVNKNLNDSENVNAVKISTIDLDSFILDNNISKIDLLKIDVETHEAEVLEGYQKFIKQHQPTMLIEILNDEVGINVEKLISNLNYLYFNIDENGGIRKVNKITKSDYYNYLICKEEIAKQLNLIN